MFRLIPLLPPRSVLAALIALLLALISDSASATKSWTWARLQANNKEWVFDKGLATVDVGQGHLHATLYDESDPGLVRITIQGQMKGSKIVATLSIMNTDQPSYKLEGKYEKHEIHLESDVIGEAEQVVFVGPGECVFLNATELR
jgi:hypothetical protein